MLKKRQSKKAQDKQAQTICEEKEMILREGTSFHVTEAYKAARTNIMFSLAGKGCKKILIISSFAGEGKSTNCINLAITFAQTGAKVIIIEADMRRPTIHRKLDVINGNGLSHFISGFCTLEEVIVQTSYENLEIITAGHIPPNPTELLASENMEQLLASLEEKYDYIFIDTPPLNVVTDATILSNKVSGAIVVVRQAITHHKDLQEALGRLEFVGAKVLGIMLNEVKTKKDKGYGKYSRYTEYGYINSAATVEAEQEALCIQ